MKDICSAHTPSTETHTGTDCNLEMEWRNNNSMLARLVQKNERMTGTQHQNHTHEKPRNGRRTDVSKITHVEIQHAVRNLPQKKKSTKTSTHSDVGATALSTRLLLRGRDSRFLICSCQRAATRFLEQTILSQIEKQKPLQTSQTLCSRVHVHPPATSHDAFDISDVPCHGYWRTCVLQSYQVTLAHRHYPRLV